MERKKDLAFTKVKTFMPPYHSKKESEDNFLKSIEPDFVEPVDLTERMNPKQKELFLKLLKKEIDPNEFVKLNEPIIEKKDVVLNKENNDGSH